MNFIKLLWLVISIVSFSCLPLAATSWKVFIYMDSSDALNDMAIKNITDMMRVKTNDLIDLRIQLHAYDDAGLRYQVTKTGLSFIGDVALTGNSRQDFINAAQWGFADHNADHTMLIFWNHGWGILDPQWDDISQKWQAGLDALSNSCPIKTSMLNLYEVHKRNHRGFMFSNVPRTYLNNQDMITGLSFIQNNLLHGKKFDILAFDTCMGGMFEIMYQTAPYTDYLVGNQVCSLRDGFDYHGILNALNQNLNAHDMAIKMVQIFDDYYSKHDTDGIYAHTALDGSHVLPITQALDNVISLLLTREDCAIIARKARDESPRFCLYPMYTDLVSYIQQIEKLLPGDELALPIKQAINNFYNHIQKFVVAHCAGYKNIKKVHGCAVYLPTDSIDSSYTKTLFGQQSKWIKLLECIV